MKLFLLFIHTDAIVVHSFSLLNNTPLQEYATSNLFILLLMGKWVISSVILFSIRNGASITILAPDLGVHVMLCYIHAPCWIIDICVIEFLSAVYRNSQF